MRDDERLIGLLVRHFRAALEREQGHTEPVARAAAGALGIESGNRSRPELLATTAGRTVHPSASS
jgi:hypothetical protein